MIARYYFSIVGGADMSAELKRTAHRVRMANDAAICAAKKQKDKDGKPGKANVFPGHLGARDRHRLSITRQ